MCLAARGPTRRARARGRCDVFCVARASRVPCWRAAGIASGRIAARLGVVRCAGIGACICRHVRLRPAVAIGARAFASVAARRVVAACRVVSWLLVVARWSPCRGRLSWLPSWLLCFLSWSSGWSCRGRLSVRRGCRVVASRRRVGAVWLVVRRRARARRSPPSSPRAGSFLAPSSARRRYIHLPLRQDPLVCFAGSIEVRTTLFWRGLAHALAPLSRCPSAGVLACSLARAASRLATLGPTWFLRW